MLNAELIGARVPSRGEGGEGATEINKRGGSNELHVDWGAAEQENRGRTELHTLFKYHWEAKGKRPGQNVHVRSLVSSACCQQPGCWALGLPLEPRVWA